MWLRTKSQRDKEEIDFLRAQVAQLQNYILMVSPGSIGGLTPPAPVTHYDPGEEYETGAFMNAAADEARRMYSTEEEEDIEFQREEGIISTAEAERLLRSAGALSDDIT